MQAAPSSAGVVRTRDQFWWPALALAAWTLFTWVTRVPLAWSDDELDTGGKVLATVPVLVFVILALVVGGAVLTRQAWAGRAVIAMGIWSIGYWVVRMSMIATNGHEMGFVVVHAVLATIAVVLSTLAVRGALAVRG